MEALLQVRDLTVAYCPNKSQRITAVNNVSFDIAPGEAVGVLGESGCGKTTLALSLLRLLPQTGRTLRGSILFGGRNLLELEERELQKVRGAGISMVYQEPGMALNPVIKVGDQVAEVLLAHQKMTRQSARDAAKTLLAQVGLSVESGISNAYPHQLSGGQKQRVVIAQAIACRPPLIIADEPNTALDAVTQMDILALLKKLQTELGLALLFINHEPGPLAQLVDRILVMYAGRVVEEGTAEQVLWKPLHPYTQGLLQARPSFSTTERNRLLTVIPGNSPDLAQLPQGCPFEPRCSDRIDACRTFELAPLLPGRPGRVACLKYAN